MLSLLSRRGLNLLRRIDGHELTYCKGGGWWLDNGQIAGRDAKELLGLVLISLDNGDIEEYAVFTINEEGRKMLKNPSYIPEIVRHYRKQATGSR